jgi:LmbE family N-acetylglucosaminyl deacetylase
LDYADGSLAEVPLEVLAGEVARVAAEQRAELLVVFDLGGVTGHPDHCRATEAALAAGGLPVLAWALPEGVARALGGEFGGVFVGRTGSELDFSMALDRSRQHRAIACHVSQARDNPVLIRRLELQGDREVFRWLGPLRGMPPSVPWWCAPVANARRKRRAP